MHNKLLISAQYVGSPLTLPAYQVRNRCEEIVLSHCFCVRFMLLSAHREGMVYERFPPPHCCAVYNRSCLPSQLGEVFFFPSSILDKPLNPPKK